MIILSVAVLIFSIWLNRLASTPHRKKRKHQKQFALSARFQSKSIGVGVGGFITSLLLCLPVFFLFEERMALVVFLFLLSYIILLDAFIHWVVWKREPFYWFAHLIDTPNEMEFFKIYPTNTKGHRYFVLKHTARVSPKELKTIAHYNKKLESIIELSRMMEKVSKTKLDDREAHVYQEAEREREQLRNEIRHQQNIWLTTLQTDAQFKKEKLSATEELEAHLLKRGRLVDEPRHEESRELTGLEDLERIIKDENVTDDVRSYAIKTLAELKQSKEDEIQKQKDEWKRMDDLSVIEAVRKTHGMEGGDERE